MKKTFTHFTIKYQLNPISYQKLHSNLKIKAFLLLQNVMSDDHRPDLRATEFFYDLCSKSYRNKLHIQFKLSVLI